MSKEVMKLALEALECTEYPQDHYDAITALREALAEQPAQQEPVATVTSETGADISMSWWHEPALPVGTKLYTTPQPAQPAPLYQEPVAFLDWYDNAHWGNEDFKAGCWRAWDAALAQRTWVGLTDEEKRQLFEREDYDGWLDYINAIEAKLRSKNT